MHESSPSPTSSMPSAIVFLEPWVEFGFPEADFTVEPLLGFVVGKEPLVRPIPPSLETACEPVSTKQTFTEEEWSKMFRDVRENLEADRARLGDKTPQTRDDEILSRLD